MKNPFLKFLVYTFLFSASIALIGFLLSQWTTAVIFRHVLIIILYFFFVTLIFHVGMLNSIKGRPQQFVRYFMGATTLKLLIHIAAVIIFANLNRVEAINFILTFFVVYIFFTAYEVRLALSLNRKAATH